jgi:structural maintenance of chromosome 2
MKPMEILAMIEEAAGTRMYEMKKQSALKTISKKDKKVEEITRVLEQEITPTLENLRQERTQYTKWTNNQTEIERLSRFTVAYEYSRSQELLTTSAADLEKMEEEQESLKERSQEISERLVQLKKKIQDLMDSKEKVNFSVT